MSYDGHHVVLLCKISCHVPEFVSTDVILYMVSNHLMELFQQLQGQAKNNL